MSPRKERSIRDPDEHFVASLKLEMLENRTSHVAPMIAIVRLRDDEQFDSKHPEAFTYETIGGNHSRIALQQLLNENDNLRQDPQFSSRRVSVYSRMTDEQAQHLALRHNRATDFTCKMTTQDKVHCIKFMVYFPCTYINNFCTKVHLCRLRLYAIAKKSLTEEPPEKNSEWKSSCASTLMMTVSCIVAIHV